MDQELQNKLFEKYPNQYRHLKYIACDNGWFDIISVCCFGVEQQIKNAKNRGENIDFWWSDQKSKFGGLRLYYYSGNEYIAGVIHMAEAISYKVCCICGNKGQLCNKRSWFETFCDKCRIENNHEIYKGWTVQ
jgi:hypothetical protein